MALQPLWILAAFSVFNLYTVGRTSWKGDQFVARPLSIDRTTQNKLTQTSGPRVGFEPTIPVFERAKTVHALDRAATVIDNTTTITTTTTTTTTAAAKVKSKIVPVLN
jgi:hypothetical protein